MVLSRPRRLPGFRFDVEAPPLVDTLPRMDIAVFVGFASAGPLHTPVAVESVAHFREIFGDDLPLAWDPQRGQPIYAYLAPAVRDFFRNGGRRCWIIRVAGDASVADTAQRPETDFFPIPGLVEFMDGKLRPAFARARSPGAWFDAFEVGTALLSETLAAVPADAGLWTDDTAWLDVSISSPGDLVPGDLVRLSFPAEGLIAMMVVESIKPFPAGSPLEQNRFRAAARTVSWFQLPDAATRPTAGLATIFKHAVACTGISATVAAWPGDNESPLTSPPNIASVKGEPVTLNLDLSLTDAPAPGTFLRVAFGSRELWLIIHGVAADNEEGSPPQSRVQVAGDAWWFQRRPTPFPGSLALAERLSFELWVRRGNEFAARLEDLGFTEPHPHFWYALPADLDLYYEPDFNESLRHARAEAYEALWREAATPRFPVAGDPKPSNKVFLPLGMSALPDFFLPSEISGNTALERDALDRFAAELFLDVDMVEPASTSLLAEAEFVRYESAAPRRLLGIHAAMSIEEATIIAVPDAVHLGWDFVERTDPPKPVPSDPLERPSWWQFKECRPKLEIPRTTEPEWGNFLPCDIHVLPAPSLSPVKREDSTGTFTLSWSLPSGSGARDDMQFVLEEAQQPSFKDPATIYLGKETSIKIYGRSPGDYYYRVRSVVACESSDWSKGLVVSIGAPAGWKTKAPADIEVETWLTVHRALLRLSAARGDLFTVLALPEHYRASDSIDYVSRLKSPTSPPLDVHDKKILALSRGEANAMSYAACYHPWLVEREPGGDFRDLPPDGAACGVLARRAVSRGAWVAPANEILAGVVALAPAIDRGNWLDLQEARVNLLRQEPAGFLVLDADTLSDDEDLRPINVRRLMILLRRLALREGATDAFEPNDDSLRRVVQHRFEEFLYQLYARGAFAGRTASEAFEVNTEDNVNTPESVDQGRLIVELKVAPSLPLTFLTIRLVQIGDRAAVLELR
jgi:hypothetical protein